MGRTDRYEKGVEELVSCDVARVNIVWGPRKEGRREGSKEEEENKCFNFADVEWALAFTTETIPISLPIAEAQFCQTNIERIGGLSLFAIFSIKYYGMGPTNNLNRVKQLPVAQLSATMHDNLP